MACLIKTCRNCGVTWMDNGEVEVCKCGSKDLFIQFDEQYDHEEDNYEEEL